VGRYDGVLRGVRPVDPGASVNSPPTDAPGADPGSIDDVLWPCANQADIYANASGTLERPHAAGVATALEETGPPLRLSGARITDIQALYDQVSSLVRPRRARGLTIMPGAEAR
jgi:hypothetical protein